MRLAIEEARQGDFPFGAVIVRDGQLLARGRNLGRTNGDPTAHGEMVAFRRFLADQDAAALRGSTLYTSGEPCARCMGAILWCRIALGRSPFRISIGLSHCGWSVRISPMQLLMATSHELMARLVPGWAG